MADIRKGRLLDVPALKRTYVTAKLSHFLLRSKRLMQRRLTSDLHGPSSPCRPNVPWFSTLAFNYRRSGPLTWFLRIWFLRPACGTAFSSAHPILSV